MAGVCLHDSENSASIKDEEFFLPFEKLLASKDALISVELIMHNTSHDGEVLIRKYT
jgi:hypothetical protein